jgi:hypothetical protein
LRFLFFAGFASLCFDHALLFKKSFFAVADAFFAVMFWHFVYPLNCVVFSTPIIPFFFGEFMQNIALIIKYIRVFAQQKIANCFKYTHRHILRVKFNQGKVKSKKQD